MFYYTVRDIGCVTEILEFIEGVRPSEQSKQAFLSQFPNLIEKPLFTQLQSLEEDTGVSFCENVLPHIIVSIMGHAGTGKTHILKHIANRQRTMFYAPTNPAGINLQNTLWPAMLFSSAKKTVYRTIHAFYDIKPEESDSLGRYVQKMRKGRETFASYEDYMSTMFNACRPFCEKLFTKDMQTGKLSPDDYRKYREVYMEKNTEKREEYIHRGVIEYISSLGLRNKVPNILLYDTCVLEEAGRTPDYMGFLFLFHHAFYHVKYETYAWRNTIPCLIFVGSPTQSRVIDNYTPFSSLTFFAQPCMTEHVINSGCFKFKSFKDNRRVTTGNILNNTTLASVVSKLELGRPICDPLKSQFNTTFVTDGKNFFDPLFKPDYFRIAKKHKDLKEYKTKVFQQNEHNLVQFQEHFFTNEEVHSFSNLENHINVKFKSETYDDVWIKQPLKATLFDMPYFVYKTNRTCLKGFRYLLTEFHLVYIETFTGTIQQFLDTTDQLQAYMASDRSNCLSFFVKCAMYMVEDIYANQAENVIKSLKRTKEQDGKKDENQVSMQDLFALKALLRQVSTFDRINTKIFMFNNEKRGASIVLPKDIFTFVLNDIEQRKAGVRNDTEFAYATLTFNDCLVVKMYPKIKSVSTCEITDTLPEQEQTRKQPNFRKYKRKRADFDEDDYVEEDDEEFDIIADNEKQFNEMMAKLANKSFFKIMPIVLHICCTIDSTQGLTIHSPIMALLTKDDRAEDIIVALTRTSNPDKLLVANRIFDTKYETIAFETKNLIKMINRAQKKDGWL